MADHPHAWVVGEHSFGFLPGQLGAVDHDHLAGVYRAPDADPTAVVDRHPRRAGGDVDHGVEQRPVCDGVRPVEHRLGLAVRRRDRPAVEVVAPDGQRGLQLT